MKKIVVQSFSSISSIGILLTMVLSQANAAPLLAAGSFANYHFSGDLDASMSCDADVLAYNRTACGPYQSTYGASIWDYGTCNTPSNFTSPNCGFSPNPLSTQADVRVVWYNSGQLQHTVTSCSTVNNPPSGACPFMNDPSLPPFRSSTINPGQSFDVSFDRSGTYYYFCEIHPFLHGTVIVSGPGPSPNPSPSPSVDLTGSIGWRVLGINGVAVLNVTHSISLALQQGPSVSEAGSVEESVDLATRIHESGTLTQLIETLSEAYALAVSSYSYYYRPIGVFSPLLGYTPHIYTFWWVNGPLTDNAPVQILTGYSSVRGSATLDLGGAIGRRDTWLVVSEIRQSFASRTPNPDTTTNGRIILSLQFNFDKRNDLMLKSLFLVNVLATSVTMYQPGQTLCGIGGCRTVDRNVVVTQQMTATASLTLQLENTNTSFSRRASLSSGSTLTPPSDSSNPPGASGLETSLLLPLGIAGAVALGAAGLVAWFFRVRSRSKVSQEPTTIPAPAIA